MTGRLDGAGRLGARRPSRRDARPPADELGSGAEDGYAEQEHPDEGAVPEPASSARRGTTFAKATVRVDGWEQHRHRPVTLSQQGRQKHSVGLGPGS